MCLPDFIEFKEIDKNDALTGYRTWRESIKNLNKLELKSEHIDYIWSPVEGPHMVKQENSGIYAYNNNYYYYNSYNNNYYYYNSYNNNYYNNYNYNNYNYHNNNNYNGIIKQWGMVAIHKMGQRSEYAIIDTIFTIRESDAVGNDKFINWIKEFNKHIEELAKKYNAKTMHYQDFIKSLTATSEASR